MGHDGHDGRGANGNVLAAAKERVHEATHECGVQTILCVRRQRVLLLLGYKNSSTVHIVHKAGVGMSASGL